MNDSTVARRPPATWRWLNGVIKKSASGEFHSQVILAILSSAIAQAASYLAFALGLNLPAPGRLNSDQVLIAMLLLCIATPLAETLLMIPLMAGLRRVFSRSQWAVAGSVAVWALLHGLMKPGWALPAAWLFFVFSLLFEEARHNGGTRKAFRTTALVHGLNNLFVLVQNLTYVELIGPKGW